LKGDPASSIVHRREHKKRLAILQPSPDPRFLTAPANEAEPELVPVASPKWKHHEVYMRAATFQREFGYGFVQWNGPHQIEDDPGAHGFLFNDDSGVFATARSSAPAPFAGANTGIIRHVGQCSGFGLLPRHADTAS
jgi:hypothetical protein